MSERFFGSTLLEPIETKSEISQKQTIRVYTTAHDRMSESVRHSRSSVKRGKILGILRNSGVPQSRINRFIHCGTMAHLFRSKHDETKYRIACFKCHDRFCTQCSFERGRMLARSISDKLDRARTRFVTLTLQHSDEPLSEQLDHLYNSYRRLRGRKLWMTTQESSIAFTEIGYNISKQQFHCHLHILTIGNYIPQKLLSETWRKVSGGSYIVDVRYIGDTRNAVKYVTKYASKGVSGATLIDCNKAAEVINALSGRRLVIGSGRWKNIKPEKLIPNSDDWEYVKPLGFVIEDACKGCVESRLILESLHINFKEVLSCYQTAILNSE